MAYFNLKQKQPVELFKAPESGGVGKQLIAIVLLFFLALGGMMWSLLASKGKAPATADSSSPSISRVAPSPTISPSGYLQPASPKNRVELNPSILADVFDEYDPESSARNVDELTNVERQPYAHVLQYLLTHTQQEIESNITIPHPKQHPFVTYHDMTTWPSKVRGATVLVAGKIRLIGYAEFEPDFQAAAGLQGVYYGNMFDRLNQHYAVRFIENPDNIQENDSIELVGVFLKRYWMLSRRSEMEDKNIYSIMPLVVAKTARLSKDAPTSLLSPERLFLLIISAFLVLALGFVISREIMGERSRRKIRSDRRKTILTEQKQQAQETPKEDPEVSSGSEKKDE